MSGNFSRRQFVGATVLLLVGSLAYYWPLGRSVNSSHPAYLVGEAVYGEQKNTGRVTLISENAEIMRRWVVPFPVNSASHNIARPWQLLGVEKSGSFLCVIDARSRKKPSVVKSPEGLDFWGHGVFSVNGEKFYVTALDQKTLEGHILIYDSTSLNLLEQISSGGYRPQELQFDIQKPELIIIANSGTENELANLSWLNVGTGKIEKKVFADDPKASVGHFLQTAGGDIYTMGSSIDPDSATAAFGHFRRDFEKIKIAKWSADRKGEILNGYYDSVGQKIWLSLPKDESVLVLDQKTLAVVSEFKADRPGSILAVTADHPEVLMISVAPQKDGSGVQKSFDLATVKGTDEALENPRKFYSFHATVLQVALQDM